MNVKKYRILEAVAVIVGVAMMVGAMATAIYLLGFTVVVGIYCALSLGAATMAVVGYHNFRKEEKAAEVAVRND